MGLGKVWCPYSTEVWGVLKGTIKTLNVEGACGVKRCWERLALTLNPSPEGEGL
jgi:hypothetical protein